VAAIEPVMRLVAASGLRTGAAALIVTSSMQTTVFGCRPRLRPIRYAVYGSLSARRRATTSDFQRGIVALCHIAFVRPAFRESDWNDYRSVNARFAAAVIEEAKRPDPIILVQDYHFALLPKMIRERLPDATIVTFWHIPWPNAETFGICPGREKSSRTARSSVLGFHTQFH